jgi:hypothetical protein
LNFRNARDASNDAWNANATPWNDGRTTAEKLNENPVHKKRPQDAIYGRIFSLNISNFNKL